MFILKGYEDGSRLQDLQKTFWTAGFKSNPEKSAFNLLIKQGRLGNNIEPHWVSTITDSDWLCFEIIHRLKYLKCVIISMVSSHLLRQTD